MSAPKQPQPNTGAVRTIRDKRGSVLARYDVRSGTLEIKRGPMTTRVNLRELERRS